MDISEAAGILQKFCGKDLTRFLSELKRPQKGSRRLTVPADAQGEAHDELSR